ncbi:hypothetical protein [Tritonibacter mobilis]|uniref:hypothetical protein n=1 Tax=Tritonibacter mobilis TaxID=379347 RepID=UPI0013A57938|nr:hypothetical protein [Tritonibacter mobilis]
MAKLGSIVSRKPIETAFKGLYVRDLPMKEMTEKFGNLESDLHDNPEDTITRLFTELLCDENAESFEDCQTFEDINEMFSMSNLTAIMQEVSNALNPTAEKN